MKTEERIIPVELRPEDLAAVAGRLAESCLEMQEEERAWKTQVDAHKEAKKAHDDRLSSLLADTSELAEVVSTGIENRAVACVWRYYPKTATAYLVTAEDWTLVETREMTPEELQMDLFPSEDSEGMFLHEEEVEAYGRTHSL